MPDDNPYRAPQVPASNPPTADWSEWRRIAPLPLKAFGWLYCLAALAFANSLISAENDDRYFDLMLTLLFSGLCLTCFVAWLCWACERNRLALALTAIALAPVGLMFASILPWYFG